jgi:hypothetical protein
VIRRPFHGVTTRWNSDHDEVRATNIFMGDMQRALGIMLGDKGCDLHLLRDADGDPVDQMTLMFSPNDEMILRQYECAAEPVVLLSKFFQLNVPTSHLVLVHLRARIAQMREPKFDMYADISHSKMETLSLRNKTETVSSHDHEDVVDTEDHERCVEMEQCILRFRSIFANDLEIRCGLVKETENDDIVHVEELPVDIALSCLLNPLVGGKPLLQFEKIDD